MAAPTFAVGLRTKIQDMVFDTLQAKGKHYVPYNIISYQQQGLQYSS